MAKRAPVIALLGNPNSGKTSLFNLLTGLKQRVGNFPGVTVEKKEGVLSFPDGSTATIIDFPGCYSLYPTAFDEKIVVATLTNPDDPNYPDTVVYVADVTNLERHLLLLTQLKELGLPLVLALNMGDIAEKQGLEINHNALSNALDVPVVLVSARTGMNLTTLQSAIQESIRPVKTTQKLKIFYTPSQTEEKVASKIQALLGIKRPYQSLLLAHHADWLPFLTEKDREGIGLIREEHQFEPLHFQVRETMARYDRFLPVIRKVIQKKGNSDSLTDRIDAIATHSLFGPLLFLLLLGLIFQAIFAWASIPMDWIDAGFSQLTGFVDGLLPADTWYSKLLTEGILSGLGGIVIFIPQIAILFFLIGLLEEVGYMARAVFIFDKLMQKFGMNGRSIVALVSGGACAIPAVMSARTISNWRERLITIMVTPLISCSARIPIYIILVAFIVPDRTMYGWVNLQGAIFSGLYILGALAALGSAWLFRLFLKSREESFLMIELPPYRLPQLRNVLYTVREKTLSFVYEAGKIILIISVILWFGASYGPGSAVDKAREEAMAEAEFEGLSEEDTEYLLNARALEASWAGHLGRAIEPVIRPLGYDWKIGIALFTSFAAREVFVGTMATLYSIGSEDDEKRVREKLEQARDPNTGKKIYTLPTVLSLLMFYAFAMQCMSTLAVVKKETGSWKWPAIQFSFMTGLAWITAYLAYNNTSMLV